MDEINPGLVSSSGTFRDDRKSAFFGFLLRTNAKTRLARNFITMGLSEVPGFDRHLNNDNGLKGL